jgi:acrylyl-CoA reductase (NADPH)
LAEASYLKQLGATEVIDRATLGAPGKPLQKERWAAAVDSVGSHTLANACASLHYGGTAAACGLAQGMDFPASVAPFILRGVTLAGIDSVMLRIDKRRDLWQSIATDLMPRHLDDITHDISILEAPDTLRTFVGGSVTGRTRVVVKDGF